MNEHRNEAQDLPIEFKPWYRRKRVWIVGVLLVLALSVSIAIHRYLQYRKWYQYHFERPIEVTRGPWRVLDPGQPVEPLEFEVVEEGNGAVIEPGDLVQVSLQKLRKDNQLGQRVDDWWIWIGFRTKKETPFHSVHLKLASVFVGLRERGGSSFLRETLWWGGLILNN
jgi:hypothetical protein